LRSAVRLKEFSNCINYLSEKAEELTLSELFEEVLDSTGYLRALEAEGEEAQDRIENVKEFASNIAQYELETEQPSLSDFLEQISLVSDIDSLDNEADRVVLMTIHSAKGLEFNNVYLVGMEEGIFPGNQSIYGGPEEIEEERRLAYVAITRAKKKLTVTNCSMRMMFGSTNRNMPSRFVKELPEEYCEFGGYTPKYTTIENNYAPKQNSNFSVGNNSFSNSFIKTSTATKITEKKTDTTVYKVGQQVGHKTFGNGIIISVTPTGNDQMLEIAFENVGTKKIMANYAKLTV